MKTIGVVTVARSDYGYYRPVLQQIQADPELQLRLIVTGMHLSPEFGLTVQAIEQDGFEINERIEMLLSSDTPAGIAKSMGLGTISFAQVYARCRPDILLVLGDRFEMHAAVVASLPFKIPVAHIHGGESTEGAIDESIRHSLTKMSHLHFASTAIYAQRIIRMGEEPWRVVISGAPSLDNLRTMPLLSPLEIEKKYGFDPTQSTLLATFHPVTLEYEQVVVQTRELLASLEKINMGIVFTSPNADTYNRKIIEMIERFVAQHERAQFINNLGTRGYFSLMKYVAVMLGNSSSGIIEAASFKLPVVNVGNRQRGRLRGKHVIDVSCNREAIIAGIEKAVSPGFRDSLAALVNLYGDGHAAERIVENLKQVRLDDSLLLKRFYDFPGAS
jgi:UDP-hydrolysing UDP-N-acetyl-D-glucosamine 2-epimerase